MTVDHLVGFVCGSALTLLALAAFAWWAVLHGPVQKEP